MTEPVPGDFVDREEEVVAVPDGRTRAVRAIIGVIRFITGLFALVLVLHIVLVLAGANFGNSFAQFIQDFAANVNLGLNTLFTFENDSIRIAVNEGLAALLWLIIGIGLTTLIARVFAPGGSVVRRRYRV
jgi:hypothetical protein